MPGLDKTRFVDLREDLEDEFTCGICHEIFNQPMVVPCCRQTYCDDCIRQWLANNNNCPNDRAALNASGLYPAPNAMLNILNNFRIRCEYQANGCPHVCALENLNTHMRNGCAYNPDRMCTDCGGLKDENSAHNCIQTLRAIANSAGESIRDVLPAVTQMGERLEAQRERYDIEISSMESVIEELRTNEAVLQTKVESLAVSVNTLLGKVSALEEENRFLRSTTPLSIASSSTDNSPQE